MLKQLELSISKHDLLRGEGLVLVGVSGGIDSMAALHGLRTLGYPVVCAHYDHRLRPGSRGDRELVEETAARLGVPFVEGAGDVRRLAAEAGLGLEGAARRWRYRFLFSQAADLKARAVVTGHTAGDQVETVLMHLLRGAGLRGLRGMAPRTVLPEFDPEIPLVRPLLGVWREEVVRYRETAGFAFVEDETNRDPAFLRNRIRLEVLPYLSGINPKFRETLLRTAQALAADEAVLERAADDGWAAALRARGDRWIEFDQAAFAGQQAGVQARILRRGISALGPGSEELDFDLVSRAVELVRSERTTGRCDLLGGLQLMREYDRLWLAAGPDDLPDDPWPQVEASADIHRFPAEIGLAGDWILTVEKGRGSGTGEGGRREGYLAVLDGSALRFPLVLRGRSRGERFEPDGLAGKSSRLSDAMIDWKIPQRLRARWPLLVSGGRVAWIPGGRIGAGFAAGAGSIDPICVKLFRR